MFASSCDPGLLCLDADADDGCCDPDPCPGQTCQPDNPPQNFEHVGFCSL